MQNEMLITDLSYAQLESWLATLGEPAFRARQVFEWVYRSLVSDFGGMTNLPSSLRERLGTLAEVQSLELLETIGSANGLSQKGLFRLHDQETIEAVLMYYEGRRTVCISSQVGCALSCPFCATGQSGFQRNLTSGEIISQVLHYAAQLKSNGEMVSNVVFMGMGEPMANYEAVWQAIQVLNDARGLGLGGRRFVISTAGLVPGIQKLANEHVPVGLAVSLHAPTDDLRDRLVPANRHYPIVQLIEACREYTERTRRRVSFEYALMDGVNDAREQAQALGELLQGLLCHVNLIPLNPTAACEYRPAPRASIMAFRKELNRLGVANTVRLARGLDIQAGCGQLRSRLGSVPG